jgi:hypothetical protein
MSAAGYETWEGGSGYQGAGVRCQVAGRRDWFHETSGVGSLACFAQRGGDGPYLVLVANGGNLRCARLDPQHDHAVTRKATCIFFCRICGDKRLLIHSCEWLISDTIGVGDPADCTSHTTPVHSRVGYRPILDSPVAEPRNLIAREMILKKKLRQIATNKSIGILVSMPLTQSRCGMGRSEGYQARHG